MLRTQEAAFGGFSQARRGTGPIRDAESQTIQMSKTSPPTPKFSHPAETRDGKLERAVVIMRDPRGFIQDKWLFLRGKGMSDTEILEALNIASGGEVLRTAEID